MELGQLNDADFDLMMDGLDALKTQLREGSLVGMMMGALMCRTPEERLAMERTQADQKNKDEKEKRIKIERIDLIRAKVILARQSAAADRFALSAQGY